MKLIQDSMNFERHSYNNNGLDFIFALLNTMYLPIIYIKMSLNSYNFLFVCFEFEGLT